MFIIQQIMFLTRHVFTAGPGADDREPEVFLASAIVTDPNVIDAIARKKVIAREIGEAIASNPRLRKIPLIPIIS
jgi:hypothetical protein